MPPQCFHQALFSELLAMRAKSLGDPIGVKRQRVSGEKLALLDLAFPLLERAKNRRGGAEPIERIIRAKEKSTEMAAVNVADTASCVVILSEE